MGFQSKLVKFLSLGTAEYTGNGMSETAHYKATIETKRLLEEQNELLRQQLAQKNADPAEPQKPTLFDY